MKISRTRFVIFIVFILLALVAYFTGPYMLYYLIENRIISTIEELRKDGMKIKYDTLYSTPGKITIKGLEAITSSTKANCQIDELSISIYELEIINLHIIPLIFDHTLNLDSVIIDRPEIHYRTSHRAVGNKRDKNKLEAFSVNHLFIKTAAITFIDSTSCMPAIKAEFNLHLSHLKAKELHSDSIHWNTDNAIASAVKIGLPDKFYKINIIGT